MNVPVLLKTAVLSALLFSASHVSAVKHIVTVSDFQFSPNIITTVMVGDTIRWVWASGTHTTTSVNIPAGAAPWDSPITASKTSFEYKVVIPGTYAYVCTPHAPNMAGGFTASATDVPLISDGKLSFLIYPSPAKESLNISIGSTSKEDGTVRIYNALGKLMMEQAVQMLFGAGNFTIPLTSFSPGVYLIELYSGNERVAVRRFEKE